MRCALALVLAVHAWRAPGGDPRPLLCGAHYLSDIENLTSGRRAGRGNFDAWMQWDSRAIARRRVANEWRQSGIHSG